MSTKASVDFTDYPAAKLAPLAQVIHDRMTENAADFADSPVAMGALQTGIDTYKAALVARASRATADVLALAAARKALEEALGRLGNYVNSVARGDAALVEKSGFPSYTRGGPPDLSPPGAPLDLRLRHGTVSGSIAARYRPQRRASTNEVQVTEGDPNDESAWRTHSFHRSGRAELAGLPPGALIWVRVRTIGLRGVMGAWSDPAQIRVV